VNRFSTQTSQGVDVAKAMCFDWM